jgi:methylase of polypeptide subunit release factors
MALPGRTPPCNDAAIDLLHLLRSRNYGFTTVSPATHALVNEREGNIEATDLRGIFGWSRPFDPRLLDAELMELMRAAQLLEQHGTLWRSRVRISSLGQDLFMHSAFPTTTADSVFFGPDTYRFVNAIRQYLAERETPIFRAVDIGCGAGPGAITIAHAHPTAEVFAADINEAALRLAAINAAAAAARNIQTTRSDLLTGLNGQFDLIVANPPYMVDTGARIYRHGGGELGEGLSVDIVRAALPRLAPGGTLLLYTGVAMVEGHDCFLSAVQSTLDAGGREWSYDELDPDVFPEELLTPAYRRAERIAAVILKVKR